MPSGTIEAAAAESGLIRDALAMAEEVHQGQERKGGGGMSFIHHPVSVAELIGSQGFAEETVAAALLHDAIEDSPTSGGEIAARFGPVVAGLVDALTDDESIDSFEERKDEHRQRVERAGGDALAIYAADKLSNVRVLRRAYADLGDVVGQDFETSLDVKEAIWAADIEMLQRAAPDLAFVDELDTELVKLRAARGASAT